MIICRGLLNLFPFLMLNFICKGSKVSAISPKVLGFGSLPSFLLSFLFLKNLNCLESVLNRMKTFLLTEVSLRLPYSLK